MKRLYPLTAPFLSRITGTDGILSRDVLQPEETQDVCPPYISQRSRERISGCHHRSRIPAELAELDARQVTHAPVIRYHHGPGIVGPDGFATAKKRQKLGSSFVRNALLQPTTHAPKTAYINNLSTHLYFGHWLKDGVSQTYLAEDESYYLSNQANWGHCQEYRAALGLRSRDDQYIQTDEIVTYSDFAQGSLKRTRYATMKAQLANSLPAAGQTYEKVFLWRGGEGESRNFRDADHVRDHLERDGWTMLDVTSPLADLYRVLSGAKIVAAMEGSHLNHIFFCASEGTTQVVLVPHDRFNTIALGLARAVGNTCGFCVLAGDQQEGYAFEFDAFAQAVEETQAQTP